jgi:hypothetical protein
MVVREAMKAFQELGCLFWERARKTECYFGHGGYCHASVLLTDHNLRSDARSEHE